MFTVTKVREWRPRREVLLLPLGRGVQSQGREGGALVTQESHSWLLPPNTSIAYWEQKNDASRWRYDWGLETEMGEESGARNRR